MRTREETIKEMQLQEDAQHRDVLLNIQAVLATKSGMSFVKHLFEVLRVGQLPQEGLLEIFLREEVGTLRAGRLVYELVSQANPEVAGAILGKIEKDKYVQANYDATRQGG